MMIIALVYGQTMAESVVSLDLLVQQLAAATEKLEKLSAALDELEASGVPNPRKQARLEDQYDLAKGVVNALTERLKWPVDMTRFKRSEEHTSELQSLMRISY